MIPKLVNKALVFSARAHRNQSRKGTDIPYITHPAAVGMILMKAGCRDAVVAAGILHDCLEDTAATERDILNEFGEEILALVKGASEPGHDEKPWKERKSHTIEYLKRAPYDVKLVSCADKLHNLTCILDDFKEVGEKLWERFNAPAQAQVWYYSELAKSFAAGPSQGPLFQAFSEKVRELVLAVMEPRSACRKNRGE